MQRIQTLSSLPSRISRASSLIRSLTAVSPSCIYLVLASPDVSSNATGFCVPSAPPHHGFGVVLGTRFVYGFVGNPVRCPSIGAAQFIGSEGSRLPTPNGNLGGDAMASSIAHVPSTIVTNPFDGAWFDGYGPRTPTNAQALSGQHI